MLSFVVIRHRLCSAARCVEIRPKKLGEHRSVARLFASNPVIVWPIRHADAPSHENGDPAGGKQTGRAGIHSTTERSGCRSRPACHIDAAQGCKRSSNRPALRLTNSRFADFVRPSPDATRAGEPGTAWLDTPLGPALPPIRQCQVGRSARVFAWSCAVCHPWPASMGDLCPEGNHPMQFACARLGRDGGDGEGSPSVVRAGQCCQRRGMARRSSAPSHARAGRRRRAPFLAQRTPPVLLQPGHDLDEIAGPVAVVELPSRMSFQASLQAPGEPGRQKM